MIHRRCKVGNGARIGNRLDHIQPVQPFRAQDPDRPCGVELQGLGWFGVPGAETAGLRPPRLARPLFDTIEVNSSYYGPPRRRRPGNGSRAWRRTRGSASPRYDYLSPPGELKPWARRAREIDREADETYVITNNHYRAKALVNAVMLEAMLTKRKVAAPDPILKRVRSSAARP